MLKSTRLVSFPSKTPCKRTHIVACTCCVHLHTLLHVVAEYLKQVKRLNSQHFFWIRLHELFQHCLGHARTKLAVELKGRFPFNKSSGLKFRKIQAPNRRYIPVAQSRPKVNARLVIVVLSRMQKSGTGDNGFVKWKRTFRSGRPIDRLK